MGQDVEVILLDRRTHNRRRLLVPVEVEDTVESMCKKIEDVSQVPFEQLNLLICGRILEMKTPIRDLLLGPTTCLTALIVEHGQPLSLRAPEDDTEHLNASSNSIGSAGSFIVVPATPQIGSFFVWCQTCSDIKRAKLRVFCSKCESSAAIVLKEPSGWSDVLKSKRISVDCANCQDNDCFATFLFKCTDCNQVGAALSQVRGNWQRNECCICSEVSATFVFDFGCRHAVCCECFVQYASTNLQDSKFHFKPPFGYTLSCPATTCERVIKDAHHYKVLGKEKYDHYQMLATERLLALDEEGTFCPYPDCGNSFFYVSDDGADGQTYCPECMRGFCRFCKSCICVCQSDDDLTKVTIASTTRKCPGCGVDTEHNGGCAHMHCSACDLNWCFRCVKPWCDECQWDHWFF